MVDLCNTWDLHVHAAPSPKERWGDAWDLASACAEAEMAGLVLKSHHGSTATIAARLRRDFEDMQAFGGVTLNHWVGGFNPYAVELCATLGGKVVWLPTLHARQHAQVFGCASADASEHSPALSVLADDGTLAAEVRRVVELVRDNGLVLATGHLAFEEILVLHRYIDRNGLKVPLLVNHVQFAVPALSHKRCPPRR